MDAHFPIFWRIRQPAAAPHTMPTNAYLCSTSGVWSWSCHRAFFLAFFHNFTMTRTKYPTARMPPCVCRYTRLVLDRHTPDLAVLYYYTKSRLLIMQRKSCQHITLCFLRGFLLPSFSSSDLFYRSSAMSSKLTFYVRQNDEVGIKR